MNVDSIVLEESYYPAELGYGTESTHDDNSETVSNQ